MNGQIIECLESLKIPDEFHKWALKWLEHENAKEVEIREDVRAARQRAYDHAVRMLDRYTDMRAREELTEEEYRAKKTHALKEKARCFALLNDTDAQITKWADNVIAAAEDKLGNGRQMEEAVAALARTREADRAGDKSACEQALADAQRAIGP